jgi:hypothetical protein
MLQSILCAATTENLISYTLDIRESDCYVLMFCFLAMYAVVNGFI